VNPVKQKAEKSRKWAFRAHEQIPVLVFNANKHLDLNAMLLIMDDVTAQLKNKDIEQDFKKLISYRRHMRLSIILLVQFLRAIPKPIRFMVTNLIFFKPSSEQDVNIIREEYISMKKDNSDMLKNVVFEGKHDFLFLDKPSSKFYKNTQLIDIVDDSGV
jgi:hypothetical protein